MANKNSLGLTEEELVRAFDQIKGAESPDRFPMSPEISKLVGQFEGLIESLGNTLIVVREDGAEIIFTRRLSAAGDKAQKLSEASQERPEKENK